MAIAAPFPAAGVRSSSRQPIRPVGPVRARRSPRPVHPASAGVRLTARGRLALLVASSVFLLLVVLFSGQLSADAGTSAGQQGRATGVVVVQPGETLWQIAREVAPQADPRETVALIRSLNGLDDSSIEAGQSIVVPMAGLTPVVG